MGVSCRTGVRERPGLSAPWRCLNDSAPGMLVIWQMALRELKGWV
jgi:hypothetical protein